MSVPADGPDPAAVAPRYGSLGPGGAAADGRAAALVPGDGPARTGPGSAWSRRPGSPPSSPGTSEPGGELEITADVFGTAPRELTRSISLQQTLELLRTVVDVVEDEVGRSGRARSRAGPAGVGAAVLPRGRLRRRARSTPRLPRPAARGTPGWRPWSWTRWSAARRTTRVRSRAAALGWMASDQVVVVVGTTPGGAGRGRRRRPAPHRADDGRGRPGRRPG